MVPKYMNTFAFILYFLEGSIVVKTLHHAQKDKQADFSTYLNQMLKIKAPFHHQAVHNKSGKFRILGGHEARPHSRPYMASLRNGRGHYCGGALIQRKWVLTAAHCMDNRLVKSVLVVLGAHELAAPDSFVQVFSVQKSIPHPKYNRTFFQNDILLLKLNASAVINAAVRPIRLPCLNSAIATSTSCLCVGWGHVSDLRIKPLALMETDVSMISRETCGKFWNHIFESMLCTATAGKIKGSCRGDSGGPLVCRNRVEGVVSYSGKYCGDPLTPDVYTRVSFFVPWIWKVIYRF
ncbi:serine protease 57-like [Pelodytes ibericus]